MTTSSQRRFRPAVHRLEDREVPANFSAASLSDLIADIAAANATAEADTITLAAGKTFTLTSVNNTTDGATGLPVIAAGENLTIIGNGDIIERSTAKKTPAFRLFDVAAGGTLTLQNLTLQGGLSYAAYPIWLGQGGAVYNAGNLALDGVTVQNNAAYGVDAAKYGYATQAWGGGVYSSGSLTVTGSIIQNNTAIGGRGSDGKVYDEWVSLGGEHGVGGGVYIAGGTALISNSTITGNLARGGDGGNITGTGKQEQYDGGVDGGGGSYPGHSSGGSGGNGLGGGVFVGGGTLTMEHSSVTGNSAIGGAGGSGGKYRPDGAPGEGVGGGICVTSISSKATLVLDAYTFDHVVGNSASTSHNDIFIQTP